MEKLFMVFDVESIGLHGEGFAYGFTVIDGDGAELDSGLYSCPTNSAYGYSDDDRKWVSQFCKPETFPTTNLSPHGIRNRFMHDWTHWKNKGATLWADCAWPVEAGFLIQCVKDRLNDNQHSGPYPLFDISTLLFAKGFDPLANYGRLPSELPAHNPLNDARQSARILLAALNGTLVEPKKD